jgi:hypothetical protein
MSQWNKNINEAPYGQILEVTNDALNGTVILATRGFARNGMVHEDQWFFTSIYTEDGCGGFPADQLVIPNKWRKRTP